MKKIAHPFILIISWIAVFALAETYGVEEMANYTILFFGVIALYGIIAWLRK